MKYKHQRLALRVTINTVAMVVLVYVVLQVMAFLRDNIYFGLGDLSAMPASVFGFIAANVLPPALVFGMILYFACLPLQRIQWRLEAGEVLDPQALERTRRRLLGFSRLLIVINLLAFVVGFVINTFVTGQGHTFGEPHRLLVLVSNASAAVCYAFAQTALNNLAFRRLRELLGIRHIGNRKRELATTTRQIVLSAMLVLYATSYVQLNNHDCMVLSNLQVEILDQIRQGSLRPADADQAWRDLLMTRRADYTIRQDFDAAQIQPPWKRPQAMVQDQQNTYFLFGCLLLIICVAIQAVASTELRQQIKTLGTSLQGIVGGKGDLRRRLHLQSMDDLGELADLINQSLDQTADMVHQIAGASQQTRDSATAIETSLHQAGSSARQASATSNEFQRRLLSQSEGTRQLYGTLEGFAAASTRVREATQGQDNGMANAREAMHTMARETTTGSQRAAEAAHQASSLAASGQAGTQAVRDTAAAILEIKSTSSEVLRVLSMLNGIAANTNLLAMNAAIEAAHAGEQGKGFAVVADEVRKLANTAGQQTRTIKSLIETMNERVEAGVRQAGNSELLVAELAAGLLAAADSSQDLVQTLSRQQEQADSVMRALDQASASARSIRERMDEQERHTSELHQGLDKLLATMTDLAEASREQTSVVAAMEERLAAVRTEVEKNRQELAALETTIAHFQH